MKRMNIVLGVTGGIAAYKAVLLARLFTEAGHTVRVIPTEHSLQFVGAVTWEALTHHPVTHRVYEAADQVQHVRLGQEADVVVIAPATANTLAKAAAGLADDLLGTTLLATKAPVFFAPAMHTEMWEHPATQASVHTLQERGAHIVGPASGRLTGTDSGPGRMSEPAEIFDAVMRGVEGRGDLQGISLAVSAGGTREPIDPVRYIGNRSSGRQGIALALAAAARGAKVHLVGANLDESVLSPVRSRANIRVEPVTTAAELESAMTAAAVDADVLIMAAAVADFRPSHVTQSKIRKDDLQGQLPTITLEPTVDILAALVQQRRDGQTIVGFAAETAESAEQLVQLGRQKQQRKGADLLVVNSVGWHHGFESAENAAIILDHDSEVVAETAGTKRVVADAILDAVIACR